MKNLVAMPTTTAGARISKALSTGRALCLSLAVLALAGAAGCGGGEEDSGPANPLVGTWYSGAVDTSWTFQGTSSSASGYGEVRTRSIDGGSCQITEIDYTVDSSANTVTYTITRARMTGNSDYNYDSGSISEGPYRESFSLSGSSLTIGNGTYSPGSSAC